MKDSVQKFTIKNAFILLVVWTLVIFVLCATPGQYIPSADWLELLSFDKFVHASLFFILTSLAFLSAIKHEKSNGVFAICFVASVLYGASLELMQAFCFTNRSADWKDMVANTFGCTVALFFLKKVKNLSTSMSTENAEA